MFCSAIKCCCSRAKILQKQPPKKVFFNIIGHSKPQFGHTYHQMKKILQDILQTTVLREFHNGVNILQYSRHCFASNIAIFYSRHCLASNIAISPLSRLQPALELLWTFTISIFNLTNSEQQILMRMLLKCCRAFNQSFNCCDLSQTELQLEPVCKIVWLQSSFGIIAFDHVLITGAAPNLNSPHLLENKKKKRGHYLVPKKLFSKVYQLQSIE